MALSPSNSWAEEAIDCRNAPEGLDQAQIYTELLCQSISQTEAGNTDAAVKTLEKLISMPIHEVPNIFALPLMARTYWRNGQAEQAKEMLKEAELAIEVLIGAGHCRESEAAIYFIEKDGVRLAGPTAENVANRQCGAIFDSFYEQKSLEIVHSDAKLIQRYFDVRDEIETGLKQSAP